MNKLTEIQATNLKAATDAVLQAQDTRISKRDLLGLSKRPRKAVTNESQPELFADTQKSLFTE